METCKNMIECFFESYKETIHVIETLGIWGTVWTAIWLARRDEKIVVTLVRGADSSTGDYVHGVYLAIQNLSPHLKANITAISLLYPYQQMTFLEKLKHIFKFKRFQRYIGWVHDSTIFEDLQTGLPISIEPRSSHQIFIPEEKIKEVLSRYKGYMFAAVVQDALWREEYSSVFDM